MWPVLLSLGPIRIYSFGVFMFVGLFLSLYWWWKMGRDEHWEELELFDAFFLGLIVFFLSGRAVYVATHWETLHTVYRSLAILAYPGVSYVGGLVGVLVFIWLFARSHEWEVWKVMDALAVSIALALLFGALGGVLTLANPGVSVNWGIVHPGDTVRRFPLDIWNLVWSAASFVIVSKVRKNFRFFSWYKGEASVAKDGLAALIFGGLAGFYFLVLGWLSQDPPRLWVIPWLSIAGLVILGGMGYWILLRSGQKQRDLLQWVSLMGKGRK